MRILSLSTTDRGGGAEQVAWDLFNGLEERGHESWMAVGEKHSSHPRVIEIHSSPHFDYRSFEDLEIQKAWEKERREHRANGGENLVHPYSHYLPDMLPEPPDAVIAHNLHGGYFDLRALPKLAGNVPVICILHDYWLLTGHCAYPFDCERWRIGCGKCPDLTIPPAIESDSTAENLHLKRSIYDQAEVTICSPGRKLLADIEDSVLKQKVAGARHVPNGTDLKLFKPGDSDEARVRLGIRPGVPVVLLVGKDLESNRFKNFACAQKCMEFLAKKGRDVIFVALGGDSQPSARTIGTVTLQTIPFVSDRSKVAEIFRAADVLLHATNQEVAPLVLSEALASGLPSVTSNVGDASDLLGDAGIVVPAGNSEAHAEALERIIDDRNLRYKMAIAARSRAEASGGRETMITAYEDILSDLLKNRPFSAHA